METKTTYSDEFINRYRYCNVEYEDWCHDWKHRTVEAFDAVGIDQPVLYWELDAWDRVRRVVIDKCSVVAWRKMFAELQRRYPETFGENPLLPTLVHIADYAWSCRFSAAYNKTYSDVEYLSIELPGENDEAGCAFDELAQEVFPEMGDLELDMLRACITANGWNEQDITRCIELLVGDMCNEAADQLQQEFDWLTSDECIVETLEANEVYEDDEDED